MLEFDKEAGIVRVGIRVVAFLSVWVMLDFISNGISKSCTEMQLCDEFPPTCGILLSCSFPGAVCASCSVSVV